MNFIDYIMRIFRKGSKPSMKNTRNGVLEPVKENHEQLFPFDRQEGKIKQYSVKDFTFLKVIGKGQYGKVILSEKKDTDEIYAIKVLQKKDVVKSKYNFREVMVERKTLILGASHPFLTGLHSCFQTNDKLFFVMEYASGGDLLFHIQKVKKFEDFAVRFYAAEITLALQFLHKLGIIYRDLKLENILLDIEGHCKLVDFGMCKDGIVDSVTTSTFCGSRRYMAPEILNRQKYGSSVDWWSLGVVMFEMFTGHSPFEDDNEEKLDYKIMNVEVKYPVSLSQDSFSILNGFLTKNPVQRLGCVKSLGEETEILKHVFFREINWSKLENKKVNPPFRPTIKSKTDVSNFDIEFTENEVILTPVISKRMDCIYQDKFEDFSFTNTHF